MFFLEMQKSQEKICGKEGVLFLYLKSKFALISQLHQFFGRKILAQSFLCSSSSWSTLAPKLKFILSEWEIFTFIWFLVHYFVSHISLGQPSSWDNLYFMLFLMFSIECVYSFLLIVLVALFGHTLLRFIFISTQIIKRLEIKLFFCSDHNLRTYPIVRSTYILPLLMVLSCIDFGYLGSYLGQNELRLLLYSLSQQPVLDFFGLVILTYQKKQTLTLKDICLYIMTCILLWLLFTSLYI